LPNRRALFPTYEALARATGIVEAARVRLKGILTIDYVVPDYYARRPKAYMGGWARQFINISPAGKALPCHAAETLPLDFPSVLDTTLADIWYRDDAFMKFRGTSWMPEPCRSCDRREVDWGGCRCQAFAFTGDASRTDPACALAPDRPILDAARAEALEPIADFVYRQIGGAPKA
jgi:pyrroloquinoline quinone biosynthesis protein E